MLQTLLVIVFIGLFAFPNLSFSQVIERRTDAIFIPVGTTSGKTSFCEFGSDMQPVWFVDYSRGSLSASTNKATSGTTVGAIHRSALVGGIGSGAATYIDPYTNLLKSAVTDEPVFEVVGGRKALRVESGDTNQVGWSDDYSRSEWLRDDVTLTTDGTLNPSGTTNAYGIIATNAAGTHNLRMNRKVWLPKKSTITFSIFAKSGATTVATLQNVYRNNLGTFLYSEYCRFNFATETAAMDSGTSPTFVQKLSNGWYRFGYTTTHTSCDQPQLVSYAYPGESNNYTGDNVSVMCYFSGFDIGETTPTSYIPTSGVTPQIRASETSSGVTYVEPRREDGKSLFAESLGSTLNTCGDVESATGGYWSAYGTPTSSGATTAVVQSGTSSYFFVSDGSDGVRHTLIPVTKGKLYKMVINVYPDDGTEVSVSFNDGTWVYDASVTGLTQDAWNTITRYFVATTTTATGYILVYATTGKCFVDNVTVQEVTNAWPDTPGSPLPPHWTAIVWWRPGYAQTALDATDRALLSAGPTSGTTLLYVDSGGLRTYDGTTETTSNPGWAANTWIKSALKGGYLSSNVAKISVGYDKGSGSITWTEASWDGAQTTQGIMALLLNMTGSNHIAAIAFWDKILTNAQINGMGAP
jgi:hypothetical protein